MVGKSGQPFKKSRNYGESADDLQDRLDVVAALLALADEEITIPSDSLKAQFKLEWVKENELRVSGTVEQKQGNLQRKPTEKGITKKDLGVLLETYRQKPILEKARDELIQNALTCLRDLGIIQDNSTRKNQGYWQFHLCLKHQTAKREDNLQVIKNKWQEAFGQLPELKPLTPTTATLQRCILGLRGNYQDAQQKLAEISHVLQTRFKDKTLSITKVEQGRIILIVESSQTGYEQFKRLIGQEIAGFSVDYAIDEWQAICRQMLIDRKPLTSNTVIGRVYGDRNLIDEDLFVDLALVKPKRSQHEKHPQEIDPEKGSDLYNREAVEKRFAYQEFLEEVISNRSETQLAIIGEPGAGKTTLLQKLAFWLLQETDDLVIWVDLAELGNQPLGDYLEQKWLKEALGQSTEEIKADWEQKFKGGAVWLLLDGLDEMSQSDQQALNFRGWVTDARIIVTCRLNLWQANPTQLQGFQTYLTQPFQDEQMQEFIQRWFPGLLEKGEDPEKAVQLAASLWSELQAAGKERIKDLCRNPLRLTLLCATWNVEKALPETMAELYAGFVETIYKWKKKEFTITEDEKKQLNKNLGELAKASLDAETGRFRLTHQSICKFKYFEGLDEYSLVLRLGWLNEVGVAEEKLCEKVYTFYHATFQEYFAALAVEDWNYFLPENHVDCPVEGKRYRIFEPQWRQVILLWLGREDVEFGRKNIEHEEKERFFKKLLEFKDGFNSNFYQLRSQFLASWLTQEFKDPYWNNLLIDWLIKTGLGWHDSKTKKWEYNISIISKTACQILIQINTNIVKNKLIAILDNSNENLVLLRTIYCLGEMKFNSNDVINRLISFINKKPKDCTEYKTDSLHYQAIQSIGKIALADRKIISFFKDLIDRNVDFLTKVRSIKTLTKISPEFIDEASTILKMMFNDTKSNENRYCLCCALVEISPKNIDFVVQFLSLRSPNKKSSIALTKLEDILLSYQKIPPYKEKVNSVMSQENNLASEIIEFSVNTKINLNDKEIEALKFFRKSNEIGIEFYQLLLDLIKFDNSESLKYFVADGLKRITKSTDGLKLIIENFSDYCALNFDLVTYELLWNCAENFPYPEFYQAWHNPPTTPHPEITDQTTFPPINLPQALQHQPILILNAQPLANETREGEIALTLSELIWDTTCPDEDPPEPKTPAQLRRALKQLQRRQLLPHRALLLTDCEHPTPELISFCKTLTGVIAVAILTDDPLDAPLKGFPPNQPNLISAIETWLGEI